jgi:tetratricopeptide (TPR) repeat protein
MSVKYTSLAAGAVVALGLAATSGFGIPAHAFDAEEPAQAQEPVCQKGFIFDTKIKNCVAESSVVKCDSGFTYDVDKKSCVKTTALNDDYLYYQGRMLALAGHYGSAIDTLGAVGNKTSNVLTMIGYSERKLGDLQQGISIYHQALALDPKNVNTHEYLGEGYLAAGRVDLAEVELSTLQSLCGQTCVQYQALQKAIYDGAWN